MKVLLISPNTLTTPYPVYPLGLDYVAGVIAQNHEVRITDINAPEGRDSISKTIHDYLPDIIGISLRNIDNTDTTDPRGFIVEYREVVDMIRAHSKAPLVLGGSGFTLFPSEIMDALGADYGIIGEGERFPLLIEAIEDQKDVSSIPGIIAKGAQKLTPSPWDGSFTRIFDLHSPHVQFYLKNSGMLNLQTKRGCNFRCIYCTYPHIEGKDLRRVPPGEAADTAVQLQEAGAKYIFIADSIFNSDYSHSIDVAHAFADAGVSIPWGAFFAPTRPPDKYYEILADAGLTHVEFGTESLSDDMLACYRKPFGVDHVFDAHAAAIDAGLHVAHYFLFGGPGESEKSVEQTLSNIAKLNKTVLFFFCGIRIFPHTELYDMAVEEGYISGTQSMLAPVFYESEFIRSDEIIQRVEAHAKGRPNWVFGAGGKDIAKIVSRLYSRGHSGPLWEHLIR